MSVRSRGLQKTGEIFFKKKKKRKEINMSYFFGKR